MMNTRLNLSKINAHLKVHNLDFAFLPSNVSTYEDFIEKISIISSIDVASFYLGKIYKNKIKSCSFSTSSGTTGNPKIIATSLWRDGNKEGYARDLKNYISENIVYKDDVVANLFTAGDFSALFDGCNRLLEAIGVNLLPIGRFSEDVIHQKKTIEFMKILNVNVLLGTPSSILQCLYLSQLFSINLSINKIVFTGENFWPSKKKYIKEYWPDVIFYGLYGHSETGFIGMQCGKCLEDEYHFFEDWFFIEVDEHRELILTDLVNPVIPIFRCKFGDKGSILKKASCKCDMNLPLVQFNGRVDSKFNYMGNLINVSLIKDVILSVFKKNVEIQVQLKCTKSGKECLSVVIDDTELNIQNKHDSILKGILSIKDIKEGQEKRVGEVKILSKTKFIISARQKIPQVVDMRK